MGLGIKVSKGVEPSVLDQRNAESQQVLSSCSSSWSRHRLISQPECIRGFGPRIKFPVRHALHSIDNIDRYRAGQGTFDDICQQAIGAASARLILLHSNPHRIIASDCNHGQAPYMQGILKDTMPAAYRTGSWAIQHQEKR